MDHFRLDGKNALVTGAGRGLGRAIGLGLARYGASVAALDIYAETAGETAAMIEAAGGRSLGLGCDVSSEEDVAAAVGATVKRFGGIHLLVNCAASGPQSPALDMPRDSFEKNIRINLWGTFVCCKLVGAVMRDGGGGSIINFASVLGLVGNGNGNSAYSAAKGGVVGLTRELAIEWAPYGIRVNAIAPAHFRTPLNQAILDSPERLQRTAANIPLGRLGEPEEMVGPVVFLASAAAVMVTGHVLAVDGGYLAK